MRGSEYLKRLPHPTGGPKSLILKGFLCANGSGEEVRIVFQQFSYIISFFFFIRRGSLTTLTKLTFGLTPLFYKAFLPVSVGENLVRVYFLRVCSLAQRPS